MFINVNRNDLAITPIFLLVVSRVAVSDYPLRCVSCLRVCFRILIFVSLLSAGCGTLKNGRGGGEDAIFPVEMGRISRTAYHAFLDWQTLIPAAGALAFRIDHFDRKVSDWAHTRY